MPAIFFNALAIAGVAAALYFCGRAFPLNFKEKAEPRPVFIVPALICAVVAWYGFSNWETLFMGRCSKECEWYGQCKSDSAVMGSCYADSHEDCLDSRGCQDENKCYLKDGICVEAFYDDCRKSLLCTQKGLCYVKDGRCVETAD